MPLERLQKIIATAGVASRRKAEELITSGHVQVNGTTITQLGSKADAETDHIRVNGKLLQREQQRHVYLLLNKPKGYVTTMNDPEKRPTVMDLVRGVKGRVYPVGRLDYASEGLLLLTNDGELKRRLELPATGWLRRYRARVRGMVDAAKLSALANGIRIEGIDYGPIRAALDRQQGENAWLSFSLAEGKNREVRRVCEHFGWPVSRLIRLAYGPFQLGHLPRGGVEEVPPKVLREQLGLESRHHAEVHARRRRPA
jgi:23S rRNA pseudouridine2605 synthase